MTAQTKNMRLVTRLSDEEMQAVTLQERRIKWASGSDVQKTWRKYGWIPPSETKFAHIGQELLPQNNT